MLTTYWVLFAIGVVIGCKDTNFFAIINRFGFMCLLNLAKNILIYILLLFIVRVGVAKYHNFCYLCSQYVSIPK